MPNLYLSPYAVFSAETDNEEVELRHAFYGSVFKLSAGLFRLAVQFLGGTDINELPRESVIRYGDMLATLQSEKILIEEEEFRLLNEREFVGRLNPIEQAFQRGLNEGKPNVTSTEPPPLAKQMKGLGVVELAEHPSITQTMGFVECLESRESIRAYGKGSVPCVALEQFLQLTARAYAILKVPDIGEISLRNYPSGGARYPIEIYPVINGVEAIKPGIYHYEPFRHRLILLEEDESNRRLITDVAKEKMGCFHSVPAIVFILTAVFGRTCWKYRSIPLHLIHQEVGVLYQTMYLVATFLELAPCAIGAFPELAIDQILGLDPRDESQVGMFALGLRPQQNDPLVINSVKRVESSPFSCPRGREQCVELNYGNGIRETVEIKRLRPIKNDQGFLGCRVTRGRCEARLDRGAAEQLERLLAEEDCG